MKTAGEFVFALRDDVLASGINENRFFRRFSSERPSIKTAQFFAQQYYYYIRTFPQILAGLSHRVTDENVRLQIAKTVVSELGAGHGPAHFQMFETVLDSVAVKIDSLDEAIFIPEAIELVDGLREIFLVDHTDVAVGGHYAIEATGLPMIDNLYQGFRRMDGVTTESLAYFYLHLFLEAEHVDWIATAVKERAVDEQAMKRMAEGNRQVLKLLASFWEGIYRAAYEEGDSNSPQVMYALADAAKTSAVCEMLPS